jgi:single-strand DNA-binding protein
MAAQTGSRKSSNQKPASKPAKRQTEYGERVPGSLSGNLTADPELRFTQSGRAVASFSVAVNERVQNDDGEWVDTDPEYFDCQAWGQQAEHVVECLSKGNRIVAVGYFQDETYENRDGDEITKTKFTARDVGPSLLFREAHLAKPVSRSKSTRRDDQEEPPF